MEDDIITAMADSLTHLAPLPDNTKLQKIINRLYLQLRVCGVPVGEVSSIIEGLLITHGITKEQLLNNKTT